MPCMCLLFASFCLNGSGVQVIDVTCFGQVDLWRLRTSEFRSQHHGVTAVTVNLNISEADLAWLLGSWQPPLGQENVMISSNPWRGLNQLNAFKYIPISYPLISSFSRHIAWSHSEFHLWNSVRKEFLYGAQVDAWAKKKVLSLSEEIDLRCQTRSNSPRASPTGIGPVPSTSKPELWWKESLWILAFTAWHRFGPSEILFWI